MSATDSWPPKAGVAYTWRRGPLKTSLFAAVSQTDTASFAVATHVVVADESEEPPSSPPPASARHPLWRDVPRALWDDWRWQMQNAIRTTSQVAELLPHSAREIAALEQLEHTYKLAIPPYYFSLIHVADPGDPIRLQAVPSPLELVSHSGQEFEDPLEEDKDSPVPGITHRYPDRVLMVTTHVCSMYCRFCTRKRVTMDREGWDGPSHNDQRMIDYVRDHEEIRDVVVSGGDPLSLPISKLGWFVRQLAAIEHVDVIRLGTRVPVTLPQRVFDAELVDLLHEAGKIWIQTHFNHPAEITPETTRAIRLLVNAGMPVNNHTVLLKGVNDSVPVMRELMRGLLRIKARPYYLFHCDPVTGAGHFRTSVLKGLEIIEGLRGHISGLGVPTYVVDGMHGAGKIPLMPNYLLSASDHAVILRNYEGLVFRYAPEDRLDAATAEPYRSQGVSTLLAGNSTALVPEGIPRLRRRQQRAEAKAAAAAAAPVGALHVVDPPHAAAAGQHGPAANARGGGTVRGHAASGGNDDAPEAVVPNGKAKRANKSPRAH